LDKHFRKSFMVTVSLGFFSACDAMRELDSTEKDNSIIIGYLSIANSYISSAYAIYSCNYVKLKNIKLDDLFHCFHLFSNELMKSINTHEDHRWIKNNFNDFKSSYGEVELLFGDVRHPL